MAARDILWNDGARRPRMPKVEYKLVFLGHLPDLEIALDTFRRRRVGCLGYEGLVWTDTMNTGVMSDGYKAHPQSAPGDFYVINYERISCGAPHAVAPDLIGWAEGTEYTHCIWKKQPETPQEMEQSLAAFDVSDVGCYRYAGCDPTIMKRLGSDYCDQVVVGPEQIEGRPVDDTPLKLHFSLTASNQLSICSRLKDSIARVVSKFGRP